MLFGRHPLRNERRSVFESLRLPDGQRNAFVVLDFGERRFGAARFRPGCRKRAFAVIVRLSRFDLAGSRRLGRGMDRSRRDPGRRR
jgi:hypothetical protein